MVECKYNYPKEVMYLNIILSDKLKEYLANKEITDLTVKKVSNGCCGAPSLPAVKEGKPKEDGNFHVYTRDGVSIYLEKEIRVKNNTLSLDLYGFLFTKEIVVDGIEIL